MTKAMLLLCLCQTQTILKFFKLVGQLNSLSLLER